MKTKQTYPIPGNGQIELFTDQDKNLTRVGFKSGLICWIRNGDIESFKKEIYGVIKKYKVNNGNRSLQRSS